MKVTRTKKSTFTYLVSGIIILLLIIFSIGKVQEFRNSNEKHSYKESVSGIEVTSVAVFSDDKAKDKVLSPKVVDKTETYKFAKDFFKRLGKELDSSCSEKYEEHVGYSVSDSYFTSDKRYNLGVDHTGLTFIYTDSTSYEGTVATSVDEKALREALKKYGVIIPTEAVYTVNGGIMHNFKVSMAKVGDKIIDGEVHCDFYTDGTIKYIDYDLIEYEPVDESEVISEAEAYKYIKDGQFKSYRDIQSMDVKSVKLEYIANSRGYLQPIYKFEASTNGETIFIPVLAVKNQDIKNYNPERLEYLKMAGYDLGI